MQNKIEHQKQVANKVLNELELIDPYCIVAGGAARDWYLGKSATDIDVFIYAPQFKTNTFRLNTLTKLGFNITDKYENWTTNEIYKGNKLVEHLYNTVVNNEKVQLIFMKQSTFTSVVNTFPISISKAWYKNNEIKITNDFNNSVKHKIIWKTVEEYTETNKYLLKIRDKFSDYKYVTKEEALRIIKENNKDELIKKLRLQIKELESDNSSLRIQLRSKDILDCW